MIENQRIRQGILEGARLGMTNSAAARVVGLNPRTLQLWIQRARPDSSMPDTDGHYSAFVEELEQARAEAIRLLLESIRDAARAPNAVGWGAAKWLLSKLDPATYGDKIVVTGEIEHRKTYRFKEPVVPIPATPAKTIEIEAAPMASQEGEEGQTDE